ncbi:37 kDa salivary gland allergen Aed a 2-like [Anopheles ziemanni]|uniref:37 kDa salivary gland allergen Aed a 2-like n=1 Tax=Anopheles coustani TaxID=139045 RepID=UPI0026588017|nr:37 kDa salivary gland allergen Aed a 2-like [Anopheles coustani]XP_058178474.1 37 kDa salivary gland allergen Aed a 2-like [Anopheles ziemanni]
MTGNVASKSAFTCGIALLLLASINVSLANPIQECPDERPQAPDGWQPRTPEQTLYAYVRCLNDSSASVEMKIRWVMWQPDASPESQCYVKCVTEDLRLYDPRSRQFVPDRFEQQARAFHESPDDLATMYADATQLLAGTLADSECSTVFAKYAPFYAVHQERILDIFHGDLRKILVTYKQLGARVKQIGQSFVDYCERRYEFEWAAEEAKPCPNRTAVDCILRGFRWITEEGTVNVAVIERDYQGFEVARSELEQCQDVDALYQCLRAINAEALSGVIRQRNAQTAYYFDQTSQDEPWKSAVEYGQSRLNRTP